MEIGDILRNKKISSKRAVWELIYEVIKMISKQEKFLSLMLKRVNLKMLCNYFCYNLYQLMTLKINGIF
jgi:hypothetical protein